VVRSPLKHWNAVSRLGRRSCVSEAATIRDVRCHYERARERAALALHNRLESAVDQLFAFSRAALAAVALSTFMSGCGKPAAQPAGGGMPPPEVNAVTVQPHDVPVTFEYVGQTAGVREVEVRARVTGILERWNYREGAAVRAGDEHRLDRDAGQPVHVRGVGVAHGRELRERNGDPAARRVLL